MKRIFGLIILLPLLAFAKDLDAIVAVINQEIITKSDLDDAIKQEAIFNSEHASNITDKQILELLINESILVQQAKLMNISISPEELKEIINNFAKNNNQTIDSLKEVVTKQGQTFDKFSKKIERQVLAMRVQNSLMTNKQKPTEKAIDDYYSKHKADALMLSFNDRVFVSNAIPKDWQKQKPITIEITYLKALPKEYQTTILKNPLAKHYGPIKTDNGYHMVEVTAWQGEILPRTYAINILMMQAIEKAKPEIIAKIKQNMYIKVYQ